MPGKHLLYKQFSANCEQFLVSCALNVRYELLTEK